MSALAPARRAPASRPSAAPQRPTLRLVATRPLTTGRLPFALLVGGILAVGLVSLLLLHTLAAQDAFRLHALQGTQAELADVEQQLELAVQQQEAPHVLAARARELGMVPTGSIAFVEERRHGKIVGVVQAPPPPEPDPSPAASKNSATEGEPPTGDGGRTTSRAGHKRDDSRRADAPERG